MAYTCYISNAYVINNAIQSRVTFVYFPSSHPKVVFRTLRGYACRAVPLTFLSM